GEGLGAAQGDSTVAIAGVTATMVYYWGKAVPPWSPANLFNGHHRLHCVIFQVPGSTPPGAQDIVVTVGGRPSNALPFTVAPGRIWFAAANGDDANPGTWQAPFGSIRAAMAALEPGDIAYVGDGLSEPGGVVLPYSTKAATAPLALVAY